MNGTITFANRLEDKAMHTSRELKPLLQAALKKMPLTQGPVETSNLYWSEDFFDLRRSSLYRSLSKAEQANILLTCNRDTLEEAFYIEKSGMAYAAKMSLLAENLEERSLYALFCADEASHLHSIHGYMGFEPESPRKQPFLAVLDELVHHGSFNTLVYMVQIILEGWGLHHYRSLAADCQNAGLTQVLRGIIHDEAKHHGSGLVILPRKTWSQEDTDICFEILRNFLDIARIGPLALLRGIEQTTGRLSQDARIQLYQEWGGAERVAESLAPLKHLMFEHAKDRSMLSRIEAEGLLLPANVEVFADVETVI